MKQAKWEDVETLARKIVAAKSEDPDQLVVSPNIQLTRVHTPIGAAIVVPPAEYRIPLWKCYADLARLLLEAGIVQ